MSVSVDSVFATQEHLGIEFFAALRPGNYWEHRRGLGVGFTVPLVDATIDSLETAVMGKPDKGLLGVRDWITRGFEPGESFCGVDRNTDPVRLAGVRCECKREDLVETTYRATVEIVKYAGNDGRANALLCPHQHALAFHEDRGTPGKVNLEPFGEVVALIGPFSYIALIACDIPATTAYLLTTGHWKIVKCPLEDRTLCNLVCFSPGANARIDIES